MFDVLYLFLKYTDIQYTYLYKQYTIHVCSVYVYVYYTVIYSILKYSSSQFQFCNRGDSSSVPFDLVLKSSKIPSNPSNSSGTAWLSDMPSMLVLSLNMSSSVRLVRCPTPRITRPVISPPTQANTRVTRMART